ncbi:uncharacterized protein LOC143082436 [Mytilus galloprovincialis]|uniref:uncharacterized protein LOC143082436 n=1 Tax=Mytilus galloprovincialis TaxID=29158 RepID=UPI003F7B4588
MLINLAILHVVALIIKGVYAVPISNNNNQKDGQLRMYELLDEYFRDKDTNEDHRQNKYPSHLSELGTQKRGKYSWSVAYGKRDRWIAYGKRNSRHSGIAMPSFGPSLDSSQDLPVYDHNAVKRHQMWEARWGKKRTTVSANPTTKAMENFEQQQSYEGYFTKNPTFKRQQWTKSPWGKRSY